MTSVHLFVDLDTAECYAMKVKTLNFDSCKQFSNGFQMFLELKYCEENPKTCLNGGKCTSVTKDEGEFSCECPTGFKGKRCEIVPVISTTTPKPTTTSTKLPTTTQSQDDKEDTDTADVTETDENNDDQTEGDEEPASVEEIDNEA